MPCAPTSTRACAPTWSRLLRGSYPSYGDPVLARALALLADAARDWLAPGATVVAKHFWRDEPPERIGVLARERQRRFGETALTFYTRIREGA